MLNIIAEIGRIVGRNRGSNSLEFLIPEHNTFKVIVGMNFDTNSRTVKFELLKSTNQDNLSREVMLEYVFIPTEKGSRPQYLMTTPTLGYLLAQSVFNLKDIIHESELKQQLTALVDTFWIETSNPSNSRYGHVLNPQTITEFRIDVDLVSPDSKKAVVDYAAALEKALAKKLGVKAKEILYTVQIDGQPIVRDESYQQFLLQKNLESAFESPEKLLCSTCGRPDEVSTDTTRLMFKFYMTDKINFASEFDKNNYIRAVALCKRCYRNTIIGERWIDGNLRTSLGKFPMYIIPQMLYSTFDEEMILQTLKKVPDNFNAVKNLNEFRKRESEIQLDFQNIPFIFNFLFFRKAQSAFKVLALVKDVPPSRIATIANVAANVDDVAEKNEFPHHSRFDLNQIYWLTPLKKKGADHLEYRNLLQIYEHILNIYPLQPENLYGIFTNLAHIHRRGTHNLYQYSKPAQPDWALKSDTLKWNLFLLFLKKLNILNGGTYMENAKLQEYFPNGMAELFADFNYNPSQQGLALLGYVMGAVANAQYREKLENKPVLEKINYHGMSEEKIVRLFNDLFEKIRQYKRHIGYAERWWAAAKQLYELSDRSNLTANERVFYLLSGYAFHLLGSSKKSEDNNNQKTQTEELSHE